MGTLAAQVDPRMLTSQTILAVNIGQSSHGQYVNGHDISSEPGVNQTKAIMQELLYRLSVIM